MSKVILYHSPYSPFSRSVHLFTRYLNLDVEVKILDLQEDDQMSSDFVKINPQHCVPTIDDHGFFLWESRAILCYLAESRAPHLVPTSPKDRAIVNQRLYSEMGGLANKYAAIYVSLQLRLKAFTSLTKPFWSDHFLRTEPKWIMRKLRSFTSFLMLSTNTTFVMEMSGLRGRMLRWLTLPLLQQ